MNNYSRVLAMIALPVLLCLLVGGCGGGGGGLPAIVSLSITPDDFSARNGDVIQFYAFGEQEDGGSRQVTHQVSWQTSDPSVATINSDGKFTAVGPGQVEVSATYNTVDPASTQVTVSAPGSQPAAQYYPLGLHYWWQYTGTPVTPFGVTPQGNEPTLTISIPRQVVIEGQVWYELQVKGTDPQEPPNYMYLRHDEEGLAEDVGTGQPIYPLLPPVQTGHRWIDPDDPEHYFIIEATDETVTVPAGTYTDCVKVREHRITLAQIEYDLFTWFAPDVGPIVTRYPETDPDSGQTTWIEQRLLQVQLGLP